MNLPILLQITLKLLIHARENDVVILRLSYTFFFTSFKLYVCSFNVSLETGWLVLFPVTEKVRFESNVA